MSASVSHLHVPWAPGTPGCPSVLSPKLRKSAPPPASGPHMPHSQGASPVWPVGGKGGAAWSNRLLGHPPDSLLLPLHRSLCSHLLPAFRPPPVADSPPRRTLTDGVAIGLLSLLGLPGARAEARTKDGEPKAQKSQPCRSLPPARPRPSSPEVPAPQACRADRWAHPRPGDTGKDSAVTWRWPPGSQLLGPAGRRIEHQTAGPARAPGAPAPPRRAAPTSTCHRGFSLAPICGAQVRL